MRPYWQIMEALNETGGERADAIAAAFNAGDAEEFMRLSSEAVERYWGEREWELVDMEIYGEQQ